MHKFIFWRHFEQPANGTTPSLLSNSQGDFNLQYVKLLLGDKGTESQPKTKLETQLMQSQKWKQETEYPRHTSYNTELDHNFITRVWKVLNFELLYHEDVSFARCPHCKPKPEFWSLFPFLHSNHALQRAPAALIRPSHGRAHGATSGLGVHGSASS